MSATTGANVISAPTGRFTVLMATGVATLFATAFLVLYVVWPEKMGPSPEHPTADTLTEVAVCAVVAWSVTAFLWVVIDREVALADDRIIVIRGTGRRATLSRTDVKGVHSFRVRNWYLTWISCGRGAEIGRSIFFSRLPSLPPLAAGPKQDDHGERTV